MFQLSDENVITSESKTSTIENIFVSYESGCFQKMYIHI